MTVRTFYAVDDVPTNSVLLLDTPEQARALPTGRITLGFCSSCGMVHNTAFEPKLTEYSGRYESTQAFSSTFNAFSARLAREMVERFDLHGKDIIEIGCGHGEFLVQLCALGGNRGIGFDPAYLPGRVEMPDGSDVEFVADFYSDRYADRDADLVVCKMTLEHIIDCGQFVRNVRRALGERHDAVVTFQVPNGSYVFGDLAFWDVYYEHCSYFTAGALAGLFQRERFGVLDVWTDYDDQYLMIAARPTSRAAAASSADEIGAIAALVERFALQVPDRVERWRSDLAAASAAGRTTVLWGGGSKGVAFLTTVGLSGEIAAVVDINPRKAGTFMAGTGHEIVVPEALVDLRPDAVVVMNPVYTAEITQQLAALGLEPDLLPVE